MATNSSQNLGLHLWEPDDQVLRTEFNENWQKIDTEAADIREDLAGLAANVGVAGKTARIAWGTYTGTGTSGTAHPTGLTFDFYPVMVWVGSQGAIGLNGWPSVFIRGCQASHSDISMDMIHVTWQENGVSWYDTQYNHPQLQNNDTGVTYYYCVLGYDKNAENG